MRHALQLSFLVAWLCVGVRAMAADPSPEQVEFFEKHVRPIFVQYCYECHSAGAKELKGKLRLDTKAAMVAGGESGTAIVPGDPKASLFLKVLRHEVEGIEMPPKGKLPDETIARLEEWVKLGAPDPRGGEAPPKVADDVLGRAKGHWAFERPRGAPLPEVKDAAWPRTEIDRYVVARLESKGMTPSGEADRRTLLRRLSYDLIGLPPTHAEVESFVRDQADGAYERVVERLLSSQQFGERWARHWLDLSRFGDTKGYVFTEDRNYPDAYRYRDFVIKAFNDDLPYDQFVTLQLAADQTPKDNKDPGTLAAMGFLTLGRRFINNQNEIIDDRIDVLTRTTMGLTVTCARCHDHKYDPVTQKDYYALYGVFASSNEPKDAPSPLRLVDGNVHNVRVFLRGNQANQGDEVPRRFIAVLSPEQKPEPFKQGSGRVELAQAITAPANPLTARVWVNRVWSHLFGVGLVRTTSDFGRRSDPPAHPDVLDYLAVKLVEEGWSTKKLLTRIVLSSTYRQTSTPSRERQRPEADPENTLLAHQNRKRLDFETLRDSLLVAAGDVDMTVSGPSVKITESPFPRRRTLYAHIDRQNLPGLFRTFDFASPDTHAPQRFETTVPQQALYLLNSPFALEQAERAAARAKAAGESTSDRVKALYRLVLQREPDESEVALGSRFVEGGGPIADAPMKATPVWQYGYGLVDDAKARVTSFTAFPNFNGATWQAGKQLPDEQFRWTLLTAAGGHPGDKPELSAIRRWTAPNAGTLTIKGRLKHASDQGDGVRARIVSSRGGVAGSWESKDNRVETALDKLEVQPGDTIDLVVDCRGSDGFDSFEWKCELLLDTPNGQKRFHTMEDFRGPQKTATQFDAWARYAQALMVSNEFVFVD